MSVWLSLNLITSLALRAGWQAGRLERSATSDCFLTQWATHWGGKTSKKVKPNGPAPPRAPGRLTSRLLATQPVRAQAAPRPAPLSIRPSSLSSPLVCFSGPGNRSASLLPKQMSNRGTQSQSSLANKKEFLPWGDWLKELPPSLWPSLPQGKGRESWTLFLQKAAAQETFSLPPPPTTSMKGLGDGRGGCVNDGR